MIGAGLNVWQAIRGGTIGAALGGDGGADTTAPTLSVPVDTATGATTATVGATTNEGNGILYVVVTTSATPPTAAQIRAGQDNSGAAATYAANVAVASTGAKTFSATGLTAATAYTAHLTQDDAALNHSNVVSGDGLTTKEAFALTYNAGSATSNFSAGSTTTFAGMALGAVVTGSDVRWTIVAIGMAANSNQTTNSLTVGGLSATKVKDFGSAVVGAPSLWIVDTSSLSTTATVVATESASVTGVGCATWRMPNPGSSTPTATDATSHTLGVSTLTLNIPTGGVAVGVVQASDGTVLGTTTWTGTASPSEDYDFDAANTQKNMQSGSRSTATGSSLTMIATSTRTAPIGQHAVAASWGP